MMITSGDVFFSGGGGALILIVFIVFLIVGIFASVLHILLCMSYKTDLQVLAPKELLHVFQKCQFSEGEQNKYK